VHATGGRLLVRSREGTRWGTGKRGIIITVADSGPGMNVDTASRVFEPFFTTKGIHGTDLGLWVSEDIIKRHHGRLSLKSSQAAKHFGTVFTMFLPFDAVIQKAKDGARPPEEIPHT
jgi:signal transduction histidine kinase